MHHLCVVHDLRLRRLFEEDRPRGDAGEHRHRDDDGNADVVRRRLRLLDDDRRGSCRRRERRGRGRRGRRRGSGGRGHRERIRRGERQALRRRRVRRLLVERLLVELLRGREARRDWNDVAARGRRGPRRRAGHHRSRGAPRHVRRRRDALHRRRVRRDERHLRLRRRLRHELREVGHRLDGAPLLISCQTSESSVTAPSAALQRSSAMRIGPTGTPLIAAYHSSVADSSRCPGSSSFLICLLNAPASPASGRPDTGRGGAGFAAERLVAREDFGSPAGFGGGGRAGPAGAAAPGSGGRRDRDARFGHGRTHLDHVPALAALHADSSCRRPCRRFGIRFALIAEKLHAVLVRPRARGPQIAGDASGPG